MNTQYRWVVGGAALGVSVVAAAEPLGFDAHTFRPSVDAPQTVIVDDAGSPSEALTGVGRATLQWAKRPLVQRLDGTDNVAAVDDLVALDLAGAAQWRRWRLGAHLPLVAGVTSGADLGGGGVGDLSLDGRATVLDRAVSPFGLAASMRVQVPTSTLAAPIGGAGPQWEASVIVDQRWRDVFLLANAGYRGVRRFDASPSWWGDQLVLRVGAGWQPAPRSGFAVETQARTLVRGLGADPLAASNDGARRAARGAGSPVEGMVSGWHDLGSVRIVGGVATGLSGGVGSPRARVVLGIAWGASPIGMTPVAGDST